MDFSGELTVDQLIDLWFPLQDTCMTPPSSGQGNQPVLSPLRFSLAGPAGVPEFTGSRKVWLKLDNRTQEGYDRRRKDLEQCFADQERCGFFTEQFTVEGYLPGYLNPRSTDNDGFDEHYNMFFATAIADAAGRINWSCWFLDPNWQSPSFMSPDNLDDLQLVLQDRTRFRLLRDWPPG